jgi:tetratricopeptide (TPR) repeat protein
MKKMTNLTAIVFLTAVMVGLSIPAPAQDAAAVKALQAAKAELQAGINAWETDHLLKARDMFIGCLLKLDKPNPYFYYYAALADYRLGSIYLASEATADADRFVSEGEDFIGKAIEADPEFGEASSLYGFLLGLEVALHQERAISVGFKSLNLINVGIEKDPSNPRTHLIKGMYLLYVPEAFGGGADNSISALEKALSLFSDKVANDPVKPTWGKDECLAYLGECWHQKGDLIKAREYFKKALDLNPELYYARYLLAEIDKKF